MLGRTARIYRATHALLRQQQGKVARVSTVSQRFSSMELLTNVTFPMRDAKAGAAYAPITPQMLIDGKLVDTTKTFVVTNPATGEPAGHCPDCTVEDVDRAVAAAKAAFPAWAETPLQKRRECLAEALKILALHANELADIITKEQGKPRGGESTERLGVGANGEILFCYELGKNALLLDPKPELGRETATHRIEIRRKPVGVVAGISPWNYPLLTLVQKLYPAVVLGNTFVAKPSPFTPLSVLHYLALIKDCFPPGVINAVVSNDRIASNFSAGRHLTGHKDVRKVSFTGSEATGIAIMGACANDVKRVTLELGGNDAAIVCADVPVKETAAQVFAAAFENTGQVCVALKRAYVHSSIYDEFVKELAENAKKARVGDGMAETTDYGPLNNEMQLNKVIDIVEDAKKNSATIVTGGHKREGAGYFYEPTIVSGVKEGLALVDEEQFGPVLPVISFDDENDAVERANALRFGLGGSVWSSDAKKANALASRLDAGTVWVNEHLGDTVGCPFGGFKHSGLGREGGISDVSAYTEIQTIKVLKE